MRTPAARPIGLALLALACASPARALVSTEQLVNGSLNSSGADEAPAGWTSSNNAAHGPDSTTTRSPGTAWAFWQDGSLGQDILVDVYPGERIRAGGYLLTPAGDRLRGGSKYGVIDLAFYAAGTLVTNCPASPCIDSNSPPDTWIYSSVEATMPSNATTVRVTVRCGNGASGDGRFLADDLSVTNRTCLQNLLANGSLSYTSGLTPTSWLSWNTNFGPETATYLTGPNGWTVWDEGGIYQDITSGFAAGDLLAFGYWALQPRSNPFDTTGPASQMRLLFYNSEGGTIEANWAMPYLKSTNSGSSWQYRTNLDEWVFSHNLSRVPSNTVRVRIEIRQHSFEYGNGRFIADNAFLANLANESNLLVNPILDGAGLAPTGWGQWNDGSHEADVTVFRSPGNAWAFWWDGGLYQNVTEGLEPGYAVAFGAHFLTPGTDALRNGSKCGKVCLEFYAGTQLLATHEAPTAVDQNSARDSWILCEGSAVVPFGATSARLVIRCDNASSGDGRFLTDDPYVRAISPPYKNFSTASIMSYGGFGDHAPPPHDSNWSNFTILDARVHTSGDGTMIHFWGCNWKWMDATLGGTQEYAVTPNTVLEFDFLSDGAEAEVNGVGLAGHTNVDALLFAPGVFFQIYGTETFSNQTYRDYPGSGWKHYEIPVGQFTTNRFYAIVLANEADGGQPTSVYYRNLRLTENYWARAALRDTDADGSTDWEEGIAGTDPQSPSSRLTARPSRSVPQGCVVQWPSAATRTYDIYRSTNGVNQFQLVASNVVATPPGNEFTDTVSGVERVFYRIRAKK